MGRLGFDIMYGLKGGLAARAALLPFSLVYGAAVRFRNLLYESEILRGRELSCPVISVGNLTVGGSGKTPVAMHIASWMLSKGKRPVILSRGYGGRAGALSVVSEGSGPLMTPERSGDEPYLMAKRLQGVPIVVGANRAMTGDWAIDHFNPDCLILDDGFQHLKLKRELNVLLVDSAAGFGTGHVLPAGPLREPLGRLALADVIMVRGQGLGAASKALEGYAKRVVFFSYRPTGVVSLARSEMHGPDYLRGRKVLAVAGLANPGSFIRTLDEMGAVVAGRLLYRDHRRYGPRDLSVIKRRLASAGAEMAVTTEKDAVKLDRLQAGDLPLYSVAVDVHMPDPSLLYKALAAAMTSRRGG